MGRSRSLVYRRVAAALALGGCVSFALAVTLWRIDCPGLYYDEVLFACGWPEDAWRAWSPRGLPLMALSYVGALKSWLYWPLADRLSPALVRVPPLLLAIASLLMAAAAVHRLAGAGPALLAAALLAADPAFLFFPRLDWGPVAIGLFLRTATLLLLLQWRDGEGDRRLLAAAFLAGLGLWDKITFAWYLAALGLGVAATRDRWPRPPARTLAAAGLCLVTGAAPLLAFNLAHPLATLRDNPLLERAPPGALLAARLDLVAGTLDGERLYEYVSQQPVEAPLPCPGLPAAWAARLCGRFPIGRSFFSAALVAALALVAVLRPLRRDPACRLLAALVAGTAAVMLPVARLGLHHVPVLFPFTHMLVAVAAARAGARWPRARALAAVAVLAVAASAAAVSVRTAASFAGLCGRSAWSPAIYRAAALVAAAPGARVVVTDWGFACQLRALAPGVDLDDLSWRLIDGTATADDLRPAAGARTLLLVREPATAIFPAARERLVGLLTSTGTRTREVEVLRDLDGRPTARVLELLPEAGSIDDRPG